MVEQGSSEYYESKRGYQDGADNELVYHDPIDWDSVAAECAALAGEFENDPIVHALLWRGALRAMAEGLGIHPRPLPPVPPEAPTPHSLNS